MPFLLVAAKLDVIVSFLFIPYGNGNAIETNSLLQIFGLVAFIEQKDNDNNDNLCLFSLLRRSLMSSFLFSSFHREVVMQ